MAWQVVDDSQRVAEVAVHRSQEVDREQTRKEALALFLRSLVVGLDGTRTEAGVPQATVVGPFPHQEARLAW